MMLAGHGQRTAAIVGAAQQSCNTKQAERRQPPSQHPDLSQFKELLKAELHEQEARFCNMLEECFRHTYEFCIAEEQDLLKPGNLLVTNGCEYNGFDSAVPCGADARGSPSPRSDVANFDTNSHSAPSTLPRQATAGSDVTGSLRDLVKSERDKFRRVSRRIRSIYEALGKEYPVDNSRKLNRFVMSKTFLNISTFVVVLNAIHLGYTYEYALEHLSEPRNFYIDCADLCFCGFYILEMILRLCVYHARFFYNNEWQWNCFDAFLVGLSINEEISKFLAPKSDGGGLAGIFRVLRVLKTVKMLRIIRVMRFFRELRLLLMPIMQSMRALFWTLVMLGMIMYIFGIVILQGVVNAFLMNDEGPDGAQLKVHFGSVMTCMRSLFYSITGGNDWSLYIDLLQGLGVHYSCLFFFYIAFLMFAVLNILTGIFVDSAMQFSADDRHQNREDFENNKCLKLKVLKNLQDCDDDSSGFIDSAEFKRNLKSEALQNFLSQLEISESDAEVIVNRLATESSGGVSLETFLDCALYMKGPARSLHLHELMAECSTMKTDCSTLKREVNGVKEAQKELASWLFRRFGDLESMLRPVRGQGFEINRGDYLSGKSKARILSL